MRTMSCDALISELLAREGLYCGHISTSSLEGGLWNNALKVEAGEHTFVFKTFCDVDKDAFFPNSATDEAEALQRLSGLDVSPHFVAIWPEHKLLAYEYVEGNTWSGDVVAVAKLLKRKENGNPSGFQLGKLTPQELLAEGDTILAKCTDQNRISRPLPKTISPPTHLSLIHRDMGPNNLVGSGTKLRLIDWQCPTMGDLTEDIYSFLAPSFHIVSERNPLSDDETAQFFQALDLPNSKTRYESLAPYFSWRMAAYCHWRAETHIDADIRDRYHRAAIAEYSFISSRI